MLEQKKRKNTRLTSYDYSSNGAYFLTICTKDRRDLLGRIIVGDAHPGVTNPVAPSVILSEIGDAAKTYIKNIGMVYDNATVHKYVIMPNHIHIILFVKNTQDAPASSPTKSVVAKVVNAFKSLVSRQSGESVWQRSYHDHIIRNEEDYLRIWQYMDENPAKWAEDRYYREA